MKTGLVQRGWWVVVPVKQLTRAKSRLRATLGVSRGAAPGDGVPGHGGPDRARTDALVLAMVADTVAAAIACDRVAGVIVVTDDPLVVTTLSALGAVCVPDEPGAGLNPALVHGAGHAARLDPDAGVAVLGGDLPALRPGELTEALDAAALAAGGRAFVADLPGTGTTLLAAAPGHPLAPAYGPGSAAAHRRSGAVALTGAWPSLRRDVDTAADLAAARALGTGPRVAALCPPEQRCPGGHRTETQPGRTEESGTPGD